MISRQDSRKQEIQHEVLVKLELYVSEKIHSLNNRAVTYEDVIELDIVNTISSHLKISFELSNDEVHFEVFGPWLMVKTHKELLYLYQKQTKLKDDRYLEILDKVSNEFFISLFSDTH